MAQEAVEALFEFFESFSTGEGFVRSEGGNDQVRLEVVEVLVEVAEVGRSWLEVDLIGRP